MDSALARYAFRLLVLVACAIAAWGGPDPTPTREVVELVSVFDKPARIEAKAASELASAPTVVQHAKAAPRQAAVTRSAKTSATVSSGVKNVVAKRSGARQAPKAEPPLPAMFVPIRELGLYLQARMGTARDGKAEPGNRKR